jgi:REP element-mobilizing transposase RayT
MTQTIYAADQYYHIFNRGVNRQPIFFAQRNWTFFLQRLNEYFASDKAIIIAYGLMPNHYHLLVYVLDSAFSFSVMQPFVTSYTKAINKEQDRVGALFQGRFKGILVDSNDYLVHLSRYIHRNPVDAGLVARPADWVFSSYRDYIGLRQGKLPHPGIVLGQFSSPADYAAYVEGTEQGYDPIAHLLFD